MHCDACPLAADEDCPSVAHARYCTLAREQPELWRPLLLGMVRGPAPAAPEPEPELPSLWRQAANLAKATARHALDGGREVDEATLADRLRTCDACDRLRPSDGRCSECGCPVAVKATWASESCPLGKWAAAPVPEAKPGGCGCSQAPAAE
jgi:hypothetical protein